MGVPASDIDKAQVELLAHQMRHALGYQAETLGTDGIAPGLVHFLLHAALHGTLHRKAFAHRDFQARAWYMEAMIWLRCSSSAVLRTEASAMFATWALPRSIAAAGR
jgi:hypothetical protein